MAKMIYTTYQTNSFKIIISTFSTHELPHASVIFPINFGNSVALKILTEPKISDNWADLCKVVPPEFLPWNPNKKHLHI